MLPRAARKDQLTSRQRLGLRSDQFDYLELVVLAGIVGVLGAMGNLGLSRVDPAVSWLFRQVEWNALGIERGGFWRILIVAVLATGAGGMLLLDRFFRGDVLGYGFPVLPGAGEYRQRAHQRGVDFRQGRGRGALARLGMVGGPRRTDCADRRRDRISGRATRASSRPSAPRCWSRRAPAPASQPPSTRRSAA